MRGKQAAFDACRKHNHAQSSSESPFVVRDGTAAAGPKYSLRPLVPFSSL
jgi:hypothetical protein